MELILTSNGEYINTHCSTLGRCSDRLSEKGILDSLRLAKAISDQHFDFIFCSDIGFRRTTTDLVVESLKHDNFQIIVDPKIREKGAEICSHLTRETFEKTWESDPEQAKILSRLFIKTDSVEHTPMLDETNDQVRERCQQFLQDLIKSYPRDSKILIVGNPIVNSILVALMLKKEGKEYRFLCSPCSLSSYRFLDQKREMLKFNELNHLYGVN